MSGYATLTSGGHKRNSSEVATAIADFAIVTERSQHFACIATELFITALAILVWQAVRGLSGWGPEGMAINSNHRAEAHGCGQGRRPARNMWRNDEYLRQPCTARSDQFWSLRISACTRYSPPVLLVSYIY